MLIIRWWFKDAGPTVQLNFSRYFSRTMKIISEFNAAVTHTYRQERENFHAFLTSIKIGKCEER